MMSENKLLIPDFLTELDMFAYSHEPQMVRYREVIFPLYFTEMQISYLLSHHTPLFVLHPN